MNNRKGLNLGEFVHISIIIHIPIFLIYGIPEDNKTWRSNTVKLRCANSCDQVKVEEVFEGLGDVVV